MKPVLVLKQAETTPIAMQMASGAQNPMGSMNPLLFVDFPDRTRDPIGGRTLLAPQGAQYRTQYDIRDDTPFSDVTAAENQRQIRAMGHDPKELARMSSEELEGFLERRATREAAKQSAQEVLAREMAQSGGNTQAAFEEALRRTGLGARAGRIGAGALAGLSGLMALQRANESGTDLLSALGGAGAQGYSTYRYASPFLQSLGMRGAAKISPSVGETSLPPTSISPADETPFAYQEGESKFTPADSQASFTAPTIAKPTVSEPTVQTKLPGAPPTPLSEKTYADMTGTELGEMNSDRDSMTGQSSIDEENQEKFQSTLEEYDRMNTVRDDFDEIYDSYNKMNKGNRRSFVGVR